MKTRAKCGVGNAIDFRLSSLDSLFLSMSLRVITIKEGMPTLEEAKRRLLLEVRRCHGEGISVLKIIHGYGSGGRGGVLRTGLRRVFAEYQRDGDILGYASGEDFSIFHPVSLEMITVAPELSNDPDLERSNPGVSFLWIQ